MTAVTEAMILAAGEGSRLRGGDERYMKPLVRLLGRPLICYTIDALIRAGIKKTTFVVGYESDRLVAAVDEFCALRRPFMPTV